MRRRNVRPVSAKRLRIKKFVGETSVGETSVLHSRLWYSASENYGHQLGYRVLWKTFRYVELFRCNECDGQTRGRRELHIAISLLKQRTNDRRCWRATHSCVCTCVCVCVWVSSIASTISAPSVAMSMSNDVKLPPHHQHHQQQQQQQQQQAADGQCASVSTSVSCIARRSVTCSGSLLIASFDATTVSLSNTVNSPENNPPRHDCFKYWELAIGLGGQSQG